MIILYQEWADGIFGIITWRNIKLYCHIVGKWRHPGQHFPEIHKFIYATGASFDFKAYTDIKYESHVQCHMDKYGNGLNESCIRIAAGNLAKVKFGLEFVIKH